MYHSSQSRKTKSEVNVMGNKESARTEGYKRGLRGESCSTGWGATVADSLVNEKGSYQARHEGYQQGLRDRELIKEQNKKR